MLTNTDSSLDNLPSINDHTGDVQTAYKAIIDDVAESIIAGNEITRFDDRIWQIKGINLDTADHIDGNTYTYEAALVLISKGIIPKDNYYFQRLVVRMAYNAIENATEFAWICENSRFTQTEVQQMIDLAASQILVNDNFELNGFEHYEIEHAGYVQNIYVDGYEPLQNLYGNKPCNRCGCAHDRG